MVPTLTSPIGQVLTHNIFQQRGTFREEQTYAFFEIEYPQPGNWQVQVVGQDVPSQGEQVNFQSFDYSNMFCNILGFQPSYSSNQPVRLAVKIAEVLDNKLVALRDVDVTAEIKKPSTRLNNLISRQIIGVAQPRQFQPTDLLEISKEISNLTKEITLFDDGQHDDVKAGDGIYANTYSDTAANGPYIVTVGIQGYTSQGKQINRTLEQSFQVGAIEQNSFTISDFLGLITQQATGSQIPQQPGLKPTEEEKPEEAIESLLKQILK